MIRKACICLSIPFCLGHLTAQTILNVGPGGFATIAAAVAAAPDGATILIQPGACKRCCTCKRS